MKTASSVTLLQMSSNAVERHGLTMRSKLSLQLLRKSWCKGLHGVSELSRNGDNTEPSIKQLAVVWSFYFLYQKYSYPSPPPLPRLVWTQVAKKLSVHLYFIDGANKWIWFRLRFFWTSGGAKSGATRRNHYNDIHIFLHGYTVVLANELASLIVSNLNLVSLSGDVPNIVPWAFVSLVGVSIMRTSRIWLLFPLDKTIVYETTVFC